MLYNPLETPITRIIRVPLYYTGLEDTAVIFNPELLEERVIKLNRNYEIELQVTIPAEGWVWYEVR